MEKHNCVNCGSTNWMDVEYGTPDATMIEKIEAGLVLHGGCAIQGLMQAYYCLDCDTRFDLQCTDEFMRHLKQMRYKDSSQDIRITFLPEHLNIQVNTFSSMIAYNQHLKSRIQSSALEFWKTDHGDAWHLEIDCPGYFREKILLQGTQDKPHAFKLFKALLDDLTNNP